MQFVGKKSGGQYLCDISSSTSCAGAGTNGGGRFSETGGGGGGTNGGGGISLSVAGLPPLWTAFCFFALPPVAAVAAGGGRFDALAEAVADFLPFVGAFPVMPWLEFGGAPVGLGGAKFWRRRGGALAFGGPAEEVTEAAGAIESAAGAVGEEDRAPTGPSMALLSPAAGAEGRTSGRRAEGREISERRLESAREWVEICGRGLGVANLHREGAVLQKICGTNR